MFLDLDAVLLARIQFAFTISFHIIFPSFTIGLASYLLLIESLWLKTKKNIYREIYRLLVKIFAISFGMGVVSGVVMSYQFGTNWSVFAKTVGNVLGPLMGYEVLTAFFLEASFLGIMLFGWGKVSKKMHFISTLIVAVGTLISAFWILSANSWMQTPQGFDVLQNNHLHPNSWIKIIFNPSFIYRFCHMILACFLTTSFVLAGIAAFYLLKNKFKKHSEIMLKISGVVIVVLIPIQMFVGDAHGLNTLKHQPRKIAAIESIWDTEKGAGLKLFGWPDEKEETTKYVVEIPRLGSLILTHKFDGEIKGLKEWPREDRPPVKMVFWSFRVMVGLGVLMLITAITGVVLYKRKYLFNAKLFHKWLVCMSPSGFIAVLAGWFVTEIGRQPYIVYGILRTKDAISPVIGEYILFSLITFIMTYLIVFSAGMYYIFKLIQKGPIAKPLDSTEWHVEPDIYKDLVLKNIKSKKL